jgi:hypothetical protein
MGGKDNNPAPKLLLAGLVTLVALLAYGWMVYILWTQIGSGEPAWSRKVLLLTGVEAITFAAVGWLFGREVNRGAAEAAKDAQSDAQQNAAKAGEERGKGRALTEAIRAARSEASVGAELEGTPTTKSQVDSLLEQANALFPPG